MASSINPSSIDGTYPIAGQDNDSQGFRDNFTNIKTNFTNAKSELEDLQSKVVLKQALTGESLDNDGGGAVLENFEIRDLAETRSDKGSTSGTVTFNHEDGHYQTVSSAGDLTFEFANMPAAGKMGRIRVAVTITSTAHDVTIDPATYTFYAEENLVGHDAPTGVISFYRTGTYVYEFITVDGGNSFIVMELTGRSRKVDFRTISTSVGTTGDQKGDYAFDEDYAYFCFGDYDGSTNIWTRFALPSTTW